MGDSLRPGARSSPPLHCRDMKPRRLCHLPRAVVLGHEVPVALRPFPRLLGLALLRRERAGPGLLIPRCRSVHTFGMRFALDLAFLDRQGRPLREERGVRPLRVVSCRGAAAVLEVPAQRSVSLGAADPG
jgi:uncharacterized membrane protein (UPF0127 family)